MTFLISFYISEIHPMIFSFSLGKIPVLKHSPFSQNVIQWHSNTTTIPILPKRALGHRGTQPDHGWARVQGLTECGQMLVPDPLATNIAGQWSMLFCASSLGLLSTIPLSSLLVQAQRSSLLRCSPHLWTFSPSPPLPALTFLRRPGNMSMRMISFPLQSFRPMSLSPTIILLTETLML